MLDDQAGAMTPGSRPAPGRKPSDGGLSGLGLIMQLVGGIMTAVAACYGVMFLFALLMAGGRGGSGSIILWIIAILGTSIARSVAHKKAGDRLLRDGPGTPSSALGRYLTLAAVQTAVVGLVLIVNDAPSGLVITLLLVFAAWPLVLLVLAKPKLAEFDDAVPMGDDLGFEGASILLLIFGSIGLGIGSIMLLGWLEWPSEMKSELLGVAMLAAFIVLVIRSALHLRAGVRGVSATHMDQTADAVAKYAQFGVLSSVIVGAVLLVSFLTSMPSRGGGGAMIVMMTMAVMVTWALLVWPLAVRSFFGDRQFATMLEARGPTRQLAPDRGLPTLGWLLLALGAYALATGLGGVLLDDLGDARAMRRMSDNPLGAMMGLLGSVGGKSPWFPISVAALQMWAGVELVRMSPRYKLAGNVFGVVASAVALYIYLPMLSDLMGGGLAMVANPLGSMTFASVAIALVVPVATLVFIRRPTYDPLAVGQTFE